MITRQQIIDELIKYSDKSQDFKKSKIEALIVGESEQSKSKILSDLGSYEQY